MYFIKTIALTISYSLFISFESSFFSCSSGIKRRMMESRSKPPESSVSTSGSVVTSSAASTSTAGASEPPVSTSTAGRRPVRERLGPRPPDDRR